MSEINLNIKIHAEGLSNGEVKQIKEHLNDISAREIKSLLNGNEFSVKTGENGIKVEFSRVFDKKESLTLMPPPEGGPVEAILQDPSGSENIANGLTYDGKEIPEAVKKMWDEDKENDERYYKGDVEGVCPECEGRVNGQGLLDSVTEEVIKFRWLECTECDWDQYS
tara:strand:+ start:853 stop:1353 length:501 start_codon:yes stop_codon:yes gene_type:complete